MQKFYGFDLGDAESAVSALDKEQTDPPVILPVCGKKSFVSAYALCPDGQLLIGENACYTVDASRRSIRFKSRFLTDRTSHNDLQRFAGGVLDQLHESQLLTDEDDCCFYIGCPAGWDANTRELYRAIFERLGYPPVRIVSESRAALVSACQSKYLQVGYDILSKPVLVADVGSSTSDFAYILSGHEVEMQTAGEVFLGGGLMDEILLQTCVSASSDAQEIQRIFDESAPWKTYCEFAARRLKERYFSDTAYWETHPCTETILIRYDRPVRLVLTMDADMAKLLIHTKTERLNGRSFYEVFDESLRQIAQAASAQPPELIFLTGGVCRLPGMRSWCMDIFPGAIVITAAEPEFSVARGLAWSGRIDDELRVFKEELEALKASRAVENIVSRHIDDLYQRLIDALVDPLIDNVALPVFEQWKAGRIHRLEDADEELAAQTEKFLRSEEARNILADPVARWLRPVADELEELTMPLCVRHHIPYTALSLNSYLSGADLDIRIDARSVFAVEELTWMIDSIITVIVGLLCGGSGIALISGGLTGIIAGAAISLLVLVLGKAPMERALLHADLPRAVRRLVPRRSFRRRLGSLSSTVKENFYAGLNDDKAASITDRLVDEISVQIEGCLSAMAQVVEIPLG